MFVPSIKSLDLKSVDSVLEGALRKVILTIRRKNTLNRIPCGSRDVYKEPIVRYRNHLIPDFADLRLAGTIICPFNRRRNEIRQRRPDFGRSRASCPGILGSVRPAPGGVTEGEVPGRT